MAQTQVFRGVDTGYVQLPHMIVGRYHSTVVCKVERTQYPNHALVTLNTGGYFSNTTKTRMNQFAAQFCHSQYGVYQKAGKWFVAINTEQAPFEFIGNTVTFVIEADKVDFAKGE